MSQVTPVSQWKKGQQPNPLELPSGNVALVRPVGVQAFFKAGLIPNSLMKIVTTAVQAGQAQKADDLDIGDLMSEVAADPEQLQDIFTMADDVTIYCVVEPQVHPVPPNDADGTPGAREEALLYVDEVDPDDKLFILSFALGGSRDLEPFRQATAVGVESLSPSHGIQLPTEPTP